uniref:Retrovirus-related Pol polyprotein from transposon TNT 1-94 n=1 Tax=Cajanus cajan TaxID=3821 RepID=A0A151TB89_CAJCA|nr:hypothetical protein KK1_018913 [Cajanus cajan]
MRQKSTRYYVLKLNRGVVTWKSSKQTIIFRSTMEPKFVVLKMISTKVGWLKSFLANIPLGMKPTQ